MADIDVISINPTQQTLGALHPEVIEMVIGRQADPRRDAFRRETSRRSVSLKTRLNFFFGINSGVGKNISSKLLACRMLFGGFMAFCGVCAIGVAPLEVASSMIVVGALLVLGLFARISTFCSFLSTGFFAATGIMAGSAIDSTMILLSMGSLIFCILGPGYISADSIIRNTFFRLMKKADIHQRVKKEKERLSYRAYHLS